MNTYVLKHNSNNNLASQGTIEKVYEYFSEPQILENIKWYCRIRWMVITVFLIFGLLSFFPEFFQHISIKPYQKYPFIIALILALANVIFLFHTWLTSNSKSLRDLKINLWSQIIFDLLILTVVVHFIGSLETNIPFAYLFHIVLACVFIPLLHHLG